MTLDAGPRLGHRKEGVTVQPELDPGSVSLFETPFSLDVTSLGTQGAQVRPQHEREVAGHAPFVPADLGYGRVVESDGKPAGHTVVEGVVLSGPVGLIE